MTLNISSFTTNMYDYGRLSNSKIDTNSARYKALEKKGWISGIIQNEMAMTEEERLIYQVFGGRDTIIKNMMRNFDADGNLLNSHGVAGMDATGKGTSQHQLISVSEEYRQKMFDLVKKEFIRENGVANGDTTDRTSVFTEYQQSLKVEDRLKGTWSLEQYEKQYWSAFYHAAKANDPNWLPGRPLDPSVLNSITRESVESTLVPSGNTLVRKSFELSV